MVQLSHIKPIYFYSLSFSGNSNMKITKVMSTISFINDSDHRVI